MMGGVPLPGGNSNAPVRFGDRVHRIAGPWTPSVHAYLRHVREHGAPFVPEPFGYDGEGREVLQFLPGAVPAYPLPDIAWSDAFLLDAVSLLRRLHDAGTGFDRTGRTWQQPTREPAEVIAVNDFAPYNLVVVDGRITGVIDLDQASPGPRVRDLAHLVYRLAPLSAPVNDDGRDLPVPERRRRVRLASDGYGGLSEGELLRAVPAVLTDLAEHADRMGRADHGRLYRDDLAWLRSSAGPLSPVAE